MVMSRRNNLLKTNEYTPKNSVTSINKANKDYRHILTWQRKCLALKFGFQKQSSNTFIRQRDINSLDLYIISCSTVKLIPAGEY